MNLNYMDTETVTQLFARVSRMREALELDQSAEESASHDTRTEEQAARHAYLCEVESALEVIGGFLNGEHEAFHAAREVFNTP